MRIGGVLPLSTIDLPGQLSMVVFCQGCPWRCRYCHNPELLLARGRSLVTWTEIEQFLRRRHGLLDGVVFSGGEPTLQAQALIPALQWIKAMGFRCGLHTAGCYPKRLPTLLPWLDWVGLDIKTLPECYAAITGAKASGAAAWSSLRLLQSSGVEYEVRITVHPDLFPGDTLARLVELLQEQVGDRLVLQGCETRKLLDMSLATAGRGVGALLQAMGRQFPAVKIRAGH